MNTILRSKMKFFLRILQKVVWLNMGNNKKYLFGLDIGTEGSKGIITDLDGNVIAYNYCKHDISRPKLGWAEHDAEKIWWKDFKTVSKKLLEESKIKPKNIVAIGCSAILPCMLPVDIKNKPLRPAILYGIDTRTSEEIEFLNKKIGKEKIYQISGTNLSAQSVGPKIFWLKKYEPEIFSITDKFLTATSYIVFKLTGRYTIDYCNAMGFSPLFDCRKLEWNKEMCNSIGITSNQLPEIYPANQVIGKITIEASRDTGLNKGTPVINGTGDFAAEILSTGAIQGDTVLVYGSTMLILSIAKNPIFHPSLFTSMFPISEMHMFGGGMATSASITKWFRDNFGELELEEERKTGINAYDFLGQKAEEIPLGSQGLIVLPYFSGERSPIWDEKARGVIFGLTLSHTKAHLYRAILEGIAYGVKHHVDIMEEAGIKVNNFISVGGGIKTELWVRIMSDVTGKKQKCVSEFIGAPLGDAYLAGYGVGLFNNLNPLRDKWVKMKQTIEPDMQNYKKYQDYYHIYRNLYPHTRKDMHALTALI